MSLAHRSRSHLLAVAMLALCIGLCDVRSVTAGILVVVQLHNGRVLTGEVNSRTDDTDLWLHSVEPSIMVLSSVPWSDIKAARIGSKALATLGLRETLAQIKAPVEVATLIQPADTSVVRSASVPRIRSLEVLAKLSNWDRDIEPDGLEVRVNPLTTSGDTVAVDGMITLRLIGRRLGSYERLESRSPLGFWTDGGSTREYAPRLNNVRYTELGRWSERLRKRDATNSGYILRLPFRTVNPEFDLDVALDGQLDAHFSVSGQQIVETSTPIQLRSFSPLREELQLNRRNALLPG